MSQENHYEVIIVGGSYAGLSAAMALGRSLRKTLVIDSGKPCNRFTPHSHNFLTQDGKVPQEINRIAREQVLQYSDVSLKEGKVKQVGKEGAGFRVQLSSGEVYEGQRLIIATGIKDHFPEIPGFLDCWGKSVIHCPYCHGYEFRGQKTGVLGNGEMAFHLSSMIDQLTEEIVVFTNGPADFSEEQWEKLKGHSVRVVEKAVKEVLHQGGQIRQLLLEDGEEISLGVMYAKLPFSQQLDWAGMLGLDLTEQGHIAVDDFQMSSVQGVFACGDCSEKLRSVAMSVASGNITGAMVNHSLLG